MGPVYEALGLSVGVIQHGMSPEERREVYRCDVVYCTNKELVFDFLKDRITLGQKPGQIQMQMERIYSTDARMDRLLLGGLVFAIVDEADSVLVDEARTPLIISGSGDESYEAKVYRRALQVGLDLEEGEHYELDLTRRRVELTDSGRDRIMEMTQDYGGLWAGRHRREELAHQALTAIHLFERDRDYIVRDNKVQIVDEYTGRVMADRTWEKGLHQLIEAKEDCEISSQSVTMARISYQRFFRRYLHLAGMTGTAREVTSELWSVYRLPVVKVPTNRPVARKGLPVRVHGKSDRKWVEIIARITELNQIGRPVLAGTRFVGTSEELSSRLKKAGIEHTVLNARQDDNEAQIISEAGQMGRVTVATNMAGRGTDISLGEGVADLGGLHVLATELHDAGRIDRQLYGRCGRQGDPGSYESVVSLEDNLFDGHLKGFPGWLAVQFTDPDRLLGGLIGRLFAGHIQKMVQNEHFQLRKNLLRMDEAMEKAIAFGGKGE
jgi:preprotein translocase subunit SecA